MKNEDQHITPPAPLAEGAPPAAWAVGGAGGGPRWVGGGKRSWKMGRSSRLGKSNVTAPDVAGEGSPTTSIAGMGAVCEVVDEADGVLTMGREGSGWRDGAGCLPIPGVVGSGLAGALRNDGERMRGDSCEAEGVTWTARCGWLTGVAGVLGSADMTGDSAPTGEIL
jgi:hypothetical protein